MKNPFYSNKTHKFICESNQSDYDESKQYRYILIIVMSQANIRHYKADFYSHEKNGCNTIGFMSEFFRVCMSSLKFICI